MLCHVKLSTLLCRYPGLNPGDIDPQLGIIRVDTVGGKV
jgi:hypothetical protein